MKILPLLTLMLLPLILHSELKESDDPLGRPLPKLAIIEAIEVADQYLQKKGIDVSDHFISAVNFRPTAQASGKEGPCWHITYELKRLSDGGQYFVFVFTDGTIEHLAGR